MNCQCKTAPEFCRFLSYKALSDWLLQILVLFRDHDHGELTKCNNIQGNRDNFCLLGRNEHRTGSECKFLKSANEHRLLSHIPKCIGRSTTNTGTCDVAAQSTRSLRCEHVTSCAFIGSRRVSTLCAYDVIHGTIPTALWDMRKQSIGQVQNVNFSNRQKFLQTLKIVNEFHKNVKIKVTVNKPDMI